MTGYVALMRKDADSDYGVEFPDFPGCVTAGTTPDDARRMAAEALELHVDGIRADGEPLPEPSSLEAIMAEVGSRDAVPFVIEIAVPHWAG
jgi:predicted RNase H-like HicB family nuclease